MKVLVTGGAGYVGGVSVDAILAAGHDVVVLDDLSTGHAAIVNPAARLVTRLLRRRGHRAGDSWRRERIDAILHCAARSLVGESVRGPGEVLPRQRGRRRRAAGGGPDGRRAARRLLVDRRRLRHPGSTPIREDAPLRPINPYGETKRTFEGALRWYGAAYGFRSVILRYFNVAGATARWARSTDPRRT